MSLSKWFRKQYVNLRVALLPIVDRYRRLRGEEELPDYDPHVNEFGEAALLEDVDEKGELGGGGGEDAEIHPWNYPGFVGAFLNHVQGKTKLRILDPKTASASLLNPESTEILSAKESARYVDYTRQLDAAEYRQRVQDSKTIMERAHQILTPEIPYLEDTEEDKATIAALVARLQEEKVDEKEENAALDALSARLHEDNVDDKEAQIRIQAEIQRRQSEREQKAKGRVNEELQRLRALRMREHLAEEKKNEAVKTRARQDALTNITLLKPHVYDEQRPIGAPSLWDWWYRQFFRRLQDAQTTEFDNMMKRLLENTRQTKPFDEFRDAMSVFNANQKLPALWLEGYKRIHDLKRADVRLARFDKNEIQEIDMVTSIVVDGLRCLLMNIEVPYFDTVVSHLNGLVRHACYGEDKFTARGYRFEYKQFENANGELGRIVTFHISAQLYCLIGETRATLYPFQESIWNDIFCVTWQLFDQLARHTQEIPRIAPWAIHFMTDCMAYTADLDRIRVDQSVERVANRFLANQGAILGLQDPEAVRLVDVFEKEITAFSNELGKRYIKARDTFTEEVQKVRLEEASWITPTEQLKGQITILDDTVGHLVKTLDWSLEHMEKHYREFQELVSELPIINNEIRRLIKDPEVTNNRLKAKATLLVKASQEMKNAIRRALAGIVAHPLGGPGASVDDAKQAWARLDNDWRGNKFCGSFPRTYSQAEGQLARNDTEILYWLHRIGEILGATVDSNPAFILGYLQYMTDIEVNGEPGKTPVAPQYVFWLSERVLSKKSERLLRLFCMVFKIADRFATGPAGSQIEDTVDCILQNLIEDPNITPISTYAWIEAECVKKLTDPQFQPRHKMFAKQVIAILTDKSDEFPLINTSIVQQFSLVRDLFKLYVWIESKRHQNIRAINERTIYVDRAHWTRRLRTIAQLANLPLITFTVEDETRKHLTRYAQLISTHALHVDIRFCEPNANARAPDVRDVVRIPFVEDDTTTVEQKLLSLRWDITTKILSTGIRVNANGNSTHDVWNLRWQTLDPERHKTHNPKEVYSFLYFSKRALATVFYLVYRYQFTARLNVPFIGYTFKIVAYLQQLPTGTLSDKRRVLGAYIFNRFILVHELNDPSSKWVLPYGAKWLSEWGLVEDAATGEIDFDAPHDQVWDETVRPHVLKCSCPAVNKFKTLATSNPEFAQVLALVLMMCILYGRTKQVVSLRNFLEKYQLQFPFIYKTWLDNGDVRKALSVLEQNPEYLKESAFLPIPTHTLPPAANGVLPPAPSTSWE